MVSHRRSRSVARAWNPALVHLFVSLWMVTLIVLRMFVALHIVVVMRQCCRKVHVVVGFLLAWHLVWVAKVALVHARGRALVRQVISSTLPLNSGSHCGSCSFLVGSMRSELGVR